MLVDTLLGRMFVEVHGRDSGPTIALWPSLFTHGRMWHAQLAPLGERHRVIVIDPPGHGRSFVPPREYAMDECVTAACEILDQLDAPRVAWAGLSWGGMVGMRLALRHPERVWALALLATNARAERPWRIVEHKLLTEGLLRPFGPVRPIIAAVGLPKFVGATTLRTNRAVCERVVDILCSHDRVAMLRAMRCVDARSDVLDELRAVRCPTLVLVGDEDVATPVHESQRIAAVVPGAELSVVGHAGHLVAMEAPERVTDELLRLLRFAREQEATDAFSSVPPSAA